MPGFESALTSNSGGPFYLASDFRLDASVSGDDVATRSGMWVLSARLRLQPPPCYTVVPAGTAAAADRAAPTRRSTPHAPGNALDIHSFDALVASARSQVEAHLLLLVFVKAVTQAHHNEAQVVGFEAGQGGALVPRMNVARDPHDIDGFAQLCQEARQMSDDWDMVLVARMAGEDGRPPTPERTDAALDAMVTRVQQGGRRPERLLVLQPGSRAGVLHEHALNALRTAGGADSCGFAPEQPG